MFLCFGKSFGRVSLTRSGPIGSVKRPHPLWHRSADAPGPRYAGCGAGIRPPALAHVGGGPFHPFLGAYVVVAPLPLDGPEVMLDNGLPPLIVLGVSGDVLSIPLKDRGFSHLNY